MTAPAGWRRSDASEILEQAEAIDDAQFEVIYRRYKDVLVRFAHRASDPEGVADLALLDGYRAMNRFEGRNERAFVSYLKRAARGHMVDDFNRRHPIPTAAENETNACDAYEPVLDRMWLEELLDQLSPDQQAVIESRFLHDLTGAETAARLDKDPNAIYQIQHRALLRLRKLLLMAALIVGSILSVFIIRQTLAASFDVDTTPADRPATLPVTAAPIEDDSAIEPDRDSAAIDLGIPAEAETGLSLADEPPTEPDPPVVTATTTNTTSFQPSPTETTAPPTVSALTTVATTSTSSPATSALPDDPLIWLPPDLCESEQISDTLWQHRLRTLTNAQEATIFEPPAAVRFVDGTGAVLYTVDTSGPMTTGLRPDTHGWLSPGDSNGTFSNFDDVPQPSYWGVLTTGEAAGWASIQFLMWNDSSWIDILCG